MEAFRDEELSRLVRYECRGEPHFHFVLQPYSSCISFLRFVSETGTRAVPVPAGITLHTKEGETPATGGLFPFIWQEHYELRYRGETVVQLEPQQQRVIGVDCRGTKIYL